MAYSYVPFRDHRLPLVREGTSRKRVLILAHGMRSGMKTPLLTYISRSLAETGLVTVVRFAFPYAAQGRRSPNTLPVLKRAYLTVRRHIIKTLSPEILVAGGLSLGARVVGAVEVEDPAAQGMAFLAYPLHPPNQPAKARKLPFQGDRHPLLFIQGRRDALAFVDVMTPLLQAFPNARHLIIERANHSFSPRKRDGIAVEEIYSEVTRHLAEWLKTLSD